jgi:hypothetical protein
MAVNDKQTKFIYLVRSHFAADGPEAEWNDWYSHTHLSEMLTVPGFVSATRYQEIGRDQRYLAAYEIAGPEVFSEPRYREVTGWRKFAQHIKEWDRVMYEVTDF